MGLLNTDELLAPISESNPCGICKETSEDLNLLNAFAKLQMECESARKIEKTRVEIELLDSDSRADKIRNSAGRSDDPKKDTNWPTIASQCIDMLSTKSKDTRIVSWMIEAMMRSNGFKGLSESLDFAAALVEKYGTQLFPLEVGTDDDLYALSFLDKLNQSSSLIDGLGRIPFRKGSKIGYSSKIIARHLESLDGNRRSELQETGLLMYDEIEEEVGQASLEVKQEFAASIVQAIESAKRLDQALTNKSGSSGFGFGNIVKEITTIQAWFSELAGDLAEDGGNSDSSEDAKSGDANNDSSDHAEPAAVPSKATATKPGTIQNRDDALASLVRVASFFRKTEPHSPVSYALEQAVRWGKMPLPELLMDLVQNTDVRGEVFRRLGIVEKSSGDA